MTDRKPFSLWSLIAVVLIGMPLLYVASFGPACWFTTMGSYRPLSVIYRPIFWIWAYGPSALGDWIIWYGNLGCPSTLLVEGEAAAWLLQ